MKNIFFKKLVAGFLLLLITQITIAADVSSNYSDTFVKNTLKKWMKKNNIPGVAVEIYGNGTPHAYYFGLANQELKIPVTEKTIFEVGSFTKLFTTVLLAEEINSGKMKLSDSIAKYAPDLTRAPHNQLKNVTLENLATHTSSLAFTLPDGIKTREDLAAYFATWKPTAEIGTQWRYSNIGIGLLGYVLQSELHLSINQMYRTRLLQPLHMQPVGITVPKRFDENLAQGYDAQGDILAPSTLSLFPAADAIKISAKDALYFLKAALGLPGTPVVLIKAMQLTQTPLVATDNMAQGLGWVIYKNPEKNREKLLQPLATMNMGPLSARHLDKNEIIFDPAALIDKTGSTDGYRAYIALIPSKKSGIVILANGEVSQGEIVKIGREILFNAILLKY